jgi:hypothetical protein
MPAPVWLTKHATAIDGFVMASAALRGDGPIKQGGFAKRWDAKTLSLLTDAYRCAASGEGSRSNTG